MKKISVIIISDTHGKHKKLINLPQADIIIHCGDFTTVGREHEVRNFMKWYSDLNQYTHKIIIAGNHDMLYEENGFLAKKLVPKNVVYLEDSGIEIEGINFWGTPVSKPFGNWAFNHPEEKLLKHWQVVPENTDVLITHTPPYLILDYVYWKRSHEGSPALYKEVMERIKPVLHCFGNIHGGYGIKVIENTTFINASNVNDDYEYVNPPQYFEI